MKLKALALLLLLPLCASAQNHIGAAIDQFMASKEARKCLVRKTHENNKMRKLTAYYDVMEYRFTKSQAQLFTKLLEDIRSHRLEAYSYRELTRGFSPDYELVKVWIDRGTERDEEKDIVSFCTDNTNNYLIAYVRSADDEKYRHVYVLRWKVNAVKDNYIYLSIHSIFGRDPQMLVRTSVDFVVEFGKLLIVLAQADSQPSPTAFARTALNRIYEFCDTHRDILASLNTMGSNDRDICCKGIKSMRTDLKSVRNDTFNSMLVESIDYYVKYGRKLP